MRHFFTPETAIQEIAYFYTIASDETAAFLLKHYPTPQKDESSEDDFFEQYMSLSIKQTGSVYIVRFATDEMESHEISLVVDYKDIGS